MTDRDPTNPFASRPNPARDNSGLDLGRARRAAPSGKAALRGLALTDEQRIARGLDPNGGFDGPTGAD